METTTILLINGFFLSFLLLILLIIMASKKAPITKSRIKVKDDLRKIKEKISEKEEIE